MKSKILITGASGFLGFHLINEARKRDLEVYAGVRKSSDVSHLDSHFVHLNYDSVEELSGLLSGHNFDYIIHAAAITRSKDPAVYERVNVQYAENLALAAARQPGLKSFVFVSSLAAVGPVSYHAPRLTENAPKNPVTGYGKSKQRAEEALLKIQGLPLTVIRPTAIYGPREKDLLVLFRTIIVGLDMYIGRKPQKLTFIHGEDAANALLNAAQKPFEQVCTFNLTDGNTYSRYAIADIIGEVTGRKALRVHLPAGTVKAAAGMLEFLYRWSDKYPVLYRERINEVTAESWDCDTERLRKELDFTPKYNLESGLIETIQWYFMEKWL
ncbi:MAG: NAD(P)-dependent oxidoreductase [Leadbetterella sp.]|nr:NAD(P)-dependent oxidoreductase [Leadbetterella sp.]